MTTDAATLESGEPAEKDLSDATSRQLIVQLALAEDELRRASDQARTAELLAREEAIIAALRRHGLPLEDPVAPERTH